MAKRQRQIEEILIHNTLKIKEGENNSLSDRLEEFERAKERKRQKRKRNKERMPKRDISPWKI